MDKNDLTAGAPFRKILGYMMPLLIGNIFQQLYGMVDAVLVGQILGVDALAAVGAAGGIQFMIFGFASGLAGGVSIITAQWVGAKEPEKVSRSIATAFGISAVAAVILTFASHGVLKSLLLAMNTPAEIFERTYTYQQVIFAGLSATLLYNLMASLLRALGDSRTPLYFLIAGSVLHIPIVYVFILILGMDVEGAALATVVSQGFSGVGCLVFAWKKYPLMRLKKKHWLPQTEWLWNHMKMGLSMAVQTSVTGIGVMVFQSVLNRLGSYTVAAYTACAKIESITIMPMFTIGTALATFTAQNFGAAKVHRVRRGVRICLCLNLVLSIAGGAAVVLFYVPLTELFVGEGQPQVVEIAGTYMRIVGSCYFTAAALFVYRGTMQGLGNAIMPMVGGIMELLMRIGAALFLARWMGFAGLSTAYPLAWVGASVPLVISYYMHSRRNFGIPEAEKSERMEADRA